MLRTEALVFFYQLTEGLPCLCYLKVEAKDRLIRKVLF